MKKQILLFLIVGILLFSVIVGVYAKSDNANPSSSGYVSSDSGDASSDSSSEDSSDSDSKTSPGQDKKTIVPDYSGVVETRVSGEKTRETTTITLMDQNQNRYQVTMRTETKEKDGEEQIKIKVRDVEIDSDVELEAEGDLLKAKLSNGNKQDVKIMPDTASDTAIETLQMKGLNVELKEVGEGNDLSVVYEAEGNKTVKFLGLFKVRAQVRAMISAENGEILRLEQPWWYAFAFGKGMVDCNTDNLDLCDDEAECSEAGLYWYDETCNLEAEEIPLVCDAENLDLCLDETTCIDATGYWYDDVCNVEEEVVVVLVCDIDNLDLCLDEVSCEDFAVNGTWNNVTEVCE